MLFCFNFTDSPASPMRLSHMDQPRTVVAAMNINRQRLPRCPQCSLREVQPCVPTSYPSPVLLRALGETSSIALQGEGLNHPIRRWLKSSAKGWERRWGGRSARHRPSSIANSSLDPDSSGQNPTGKGGQREAGNWGRKKDEPDSRQPPQGWHIGGDTVRQACLACLIADLAAVGLLQPSNVSFS